MVTTLSFLIRGAVDAGLVLVPVFALLFGFFKLQRQCFYPAACFIGFGYLGVAFTLLKASDPYIAYFFGFTSVGFLIAAYVTHATTTCNVLLDFLPVSVAVLLLVFFMLLRPFTARA